MLTQTGQALLMEKAMIDTHAKEGYALPDAPEGALVGRLGNRTFFIGNRGRIPNTNTSEELLLS